MNAIASPSASTGSASLTEIVAGAIARLSPDALPEAVCDTLDRLLLDYAGLCAAARGTDYVAALLSAAGEGNCTLIGHGRTADAYSAALLNGTAAHGEDFDDTFEGGPIHSSAVVLSAVLAACEAEGRTGADARLGAAVGIELMCRLSLVAPKAIHKAGFHPTAVIGALGAAAGVSAALGLPDSKIVQALGIAGSMASGIIEYLSDGSSTKRLHAGWAAQSGLRAAMLARGGFTGPRLVLEGEHGFFHAFAPSVTPGFTPLTDALGSRWLTEAVAFKPYACGTMTQPYVDCAIELASRGIAAEDIESIECEVGEGTVHRLWEPLAQKQVPPTPYFAKFSSPFCIAVGFVAGAAGLSQFTDASVRDPAVLALARKVRYVVDPANPYPKRFTGHVRALLRSGETVEVRRADMRGGAHDPLPTAEIRDKFERNLAYCGIAPEATSRWAEACAQLFEATAPVSLKAFATAA